MGELASQPIHVHVDKRGRLVLPQHIREGLIDVPGDVLVHRTPMAFCWCRRTLRRRFVWPTTGSRFDAERPVSNAEVLAAVDRERGTR